MRRTTLMILLLCGKLHADELLGVCDIHAVDGHRLEFPLTFKGAPYIITEENDPQFVPLGTALTYTTKKYNKCDIGCADLAWHNAEFMAHSTLWDRVTLTTGEIVGWGCGGEVTCREPVFRHNVQCTVEVGDCDLEGINAGSPYPFFQIKKVNYLECHGDLSCKYEGRPATDCCRMVSTT